MHKQPSSSHDQLCINKSNTLAGAGEEVLDEPGRWNGSCRQKVQRDRRLQLLAGAAASTPPHLSQESNKIYIRIMEFGDF